MLKLAKKIAVHNTQNTTVSADDLSLSLSLSLCVCVCVCVRACVRACGRGGRAGVRGVRVCMSMGTNVHDIVNIMCMFVCA